MAIYLETQTIVSELSNLIRKSEGEIFIISPYLKIPVYFKDRLADRNNKGLKTTIIYGKNEKLDDDTARFFKDLGNITLKFRADLHAKCYASDEKIIIGSLNFYDYSMLNNTEMGILVEKAADEALFNEISSEIQFLAERSQPKNSGYCIRTGKPIPFNIKKPMSEQAFRVWAGYGDDEYPEKYCHFTGEKSNGETCMRSPVMRKNYRKAKAEMGF